MFMNEFCVLSPVFCRRMMSSLLVLALIGIGIYDLIVDFSALRLVLYLPALVDIAAAIASFIFFRACGRTRPLVEQSLADAAKRADEREAAAQRRRHAEEAERVRRAAERNAAVNAERSQSGESAETASDPVESSDSAESLSASKECVVCLSSVKNMLLVPCHHIATCEPCAYKVNKCPLCRRRVQKREKVYL